jgi:hypothetical protein
MTDTMTTADTTLAPPASHPWLRLALAVVAAIELLDALSSVQYIFADHHHAAALLRFAQALTSVKLALTPLIAGAALLCTAFNKVRPAIVALAALTLTRWLLDDLWSIPIYGLRLAPDYGGWETLVHYILMPAVAAAGVLLALKDRRLALAGLLVSLPPLYNWFGAAVFVIGVMIYGF